MKRKRYLTTHFTEIHSVARWHPHTPFIVNFGLKDRITLQSSHNNSLAISEGLWLVVYIVIIVKVQAKCSQYRIYQYLLWHWCSCAIYAFSALSLDAAEMFVAMVSISKCCFPRFSAVRSDDCRELWVSYLKNKAMP